MREIIQGNVGGSMAGRVEYMELIGYREQFLINCRISATPSSLSRYLTELVMRLSSLTICSPYSLKPKICHQAIFWGIFSSRGSWLHDSIPKDQRMASHQAFIMKASLHDVRWRTCHVGVNGCLWKGLPSMWCIFLYSKMIIWIGWTLLSHFGFLSCYVL